MKKQNDFPSVEEINVEINDILNKGLKKEKGLFSYIRSAIKELGFKNIFHDKSELAFMSIISLILFSFIGVQVALGVNGKENNLYKLYGYVFLASPIIYVAVSLFSFVNTRLKGTYEIEATCKYNMYNLAAIRMFIFSIIGAIFNSVLIFIIYCALSSLNIIRAYVVSITSLFLFSTIFILAIVHLKRSVFKYLITSIWIFINLIFIINENSLYINFIMYAPLYIHLIITVICVVIYLKALKKLIYVRKEKGEI